MHPSIVNLSSRLHLCSGDVPPPLVGASATLVEPSTGSGEVTTKLYLFGGRLVSNRRMINHMYQLDLDKMKWTRLSPKSLDETPSTPTTESEGLPQPRYFHSADLWQDKMIFFGGMGYSKRSSAQSPGTPKAPQESKTDDLCVLNEVLAFDLKTQTWDLSFALDSDPQPSTSDSNSDSYRRAADESAKPASRYAHLSSITGDSLIIVGGQNMTNQYVESINVFSLSKRRWIGSQRFKRQCGSYRSLSVGARYNLTEGEKAKCYPRSRDPLTGMNEDSPTNDKPEATADGVPSGSQSPAMIKVEQNPLLISTTPSDDEPPPVFVYSNYNFTDVRRELELLRVRPQALAAAKSRSRSGSNASQESALDIELPLSPTEAHESDGMSGPYINIEERSSLMSGATLPPGLRFPTGAVLGAYLIISGTYLANATQTFSIWALHLPSLTWSRLEAGSALSSGSWNRAILWPGKNRMLVMGNKERDLVSDYNHRQTNWDHVVVLELEAWGIYQPPIPRLSGPAAQLGLNKLASSAVSSTNTGTKNLNLNPVKLASELSEKLKVDDSVAEGGAGSLPLLLESLGGKGDFEIVCSDGVRIGCDRVILESRWPWFKEKMSEYRKKALRTARIVSGAPQEAVGPGLIPEELASVLQDESVEELADVDTVDAAREKLEGGRSGPHRAHDPRFQPRHIQISEPSPIILAFLQFLYSQRICTALQRHPAVVCALLVLAKTYQLEHLLEWAKHAAHVALADDLNPKTAQAGSRGSGILSASSSTGQGPDLGLDLFRPAESLGLHPEERHRLAVCLYEASSLCGCEGLQIRALCVVMSVARWLQKHGANTGSGGAPGDRSGEANGHSSGTGPGSGGTQNDGGHAAGSGSSSHGMRGGSSMPSSGPYQATTYASTRASLRKDNLASSTGPLSPTSSTHSAGRGRGLSGALSNVENDTQSASPGGLVGPYSHLHDTIQDASDIETSNWPHRVTGSSHSKAERILGLAGKEAGQAGSRSGTPTNFRRPSALARMGGNEPEGTTGASHASAPTPARTGLKRFSLFGRGAGGEEHASNASSRMRASSKAGVDSDWPEEEDNTDGHSTSDASRTADSGFLSNFGRRDSHDRGHSPMVESTAQFGAEHRHGMNRSMTADSSQTPSVSSLMSGNSNRYPAEPSPTSPMFDGNFSPNTGYPAESSTTSASASQHSLVNSPALNGLYRSGSQSTKESVSGNHTPAMTDSVDMSSSGLLSPKEAQKTEKEEKKQKEKEEKARKKSEKAELKRLAAEAVFGPKGSAGPISPNLDGSSSDNSASASTLIIGSGEVTSHASSIRSGTSTASLRSASLKTNRSPRTPVSPALTPGEWAVTTQMGGGMWFAGPPPTPKSYSGGLGGSSNKSSRSVSSLGNRNKSS